MASPAAAVSFTGGKDSVLALHLCSGFTTPQIPSLEQDSRPQVKLLVTFAPAGRSAGSFKAHPLPVIRAQAAALQLPHLVIEIDPGNALDSYRQAIRDVLKEQHGISVLVTGDILDVAGGFMARAVQGSGVRLVMPLWQLPRKVVLAALTDLGIQSRISCINTASYTSKEQQQQSGSCTRTQQASPPPSHAQVPGTTACFNAADQLLGCELTPELVAGPLAVAHAAFGADACGEHGEFHTVSTYGPLFRTPVELKQLSVERHGVYAYVRWHVGGDAMPDEMAS